jgi:hypothetical protein
MFRMPAAILLLLGAVAQNHAAAQKRSVIPIRMRAPVAPRATIHNAAAAPATISFTATDPDLGSFLGSSPATLSWATPDGNRQNPWTLKVAASTPSFTSCSTVPASAVRVSCSSVSSGTNGQCGPAFQLSTALNQIASGLQGNGNESYSVTITFTLADSWRYVAEQSPPCTISLSYTIDAP